MTKEEDDATSALIAQMLMQDQMDNPYLQQDFFGGGDGEDSDEYDGYGGGARRRKGKGKGKGKGKAKAKGKGKTKTEDGSGTAAAGAGEGGEAGGEGGGGGGAKKQTKRSWTEEEETAFRRGLEEHGRDWAAIVTLVGTRDKNSIKSHAQNYFIRLKVQGLPLPDKVKESGIGYSLSGKPLAPDAASLAKYSSEARKAVAERKAAAPETGAPAEAASAGEPKAAVAKRPAVVKAAKPIVPAPAPTFSEPTEYALARPKRQRLTKAVVNPDDDPLTIVHCARFAPGGQPFRVTVHPRAAVLMDFHAHLVKAEIIGLLGGTWDADARVLTVDDAFPCRSLADTGEDDSTNVEMDPSSEIEVRERIEDRKMRVVGWYHSHPVFEPEPSVRDVENQSNYQDLFCDEKRHMYPFVGIIVGPYDARMPTPTSIINAFYVNRIVGLPAQAMTVEHELLGSVDEPAAAALLRDCEKLLEHYRAAPTRVHMLADWQHVPVGGTNAFDCFRNVDKLLQSLRDRLLGDAPLVDDTLRKLEASVLGQWDLLKAT